MKDEEIMEKAIKKAIKNGLEIQGKKIIDYEIPYDNKIRLTDTEWEEGGIMDLLI